MRKALGPVPLLGLLLLLSMHAWLGLDWISQTTHPGGVDEVTNLNWAYPFHLTWTNHAYDNEAWFLLGREHFLTTPPLIFIASSLLFSATEVSWHNCLTVSLLGFLVWLAAVYLLASRLAGRWAGLVAAALVGSGPMAYLFARTYNTSCLSAALITLAVYAAIASDGFKRLIPSLLVGPLVGLAFISERATPVVALAGPILILAVAAIVHSMREGGFKRVAALESFAAIVALALSLPFLYTYLGSTWEHNVELMGQAANEVAGPWQESHPEWMHYIVGLLTAQQVPLVALAALLGLMPALIHLKTRALALLAWLIVPIVFFTPIAQKSLNYTFSISAPLAILAAAGLTLVKTRSMARPCNILLGLLLAFGVLKPLDTAFGWRILHAPERTEPDSIVRKLIDPVQFQIPEPAPLEGYRWAEEVDRLLKESPGDVVLFLSAQEGYPIEDARIMFAFTLAQRPRAKAYMLMEPCSIWSDAEIPSGGVVGVAVLPVKLKTSEALAAQVAYDVWGSSEYSRYVQGDEADHVCRDLINATLVPRPQNDIGNGRTLVSYIIEGDLSGPRPDSDSIEP